MHFTIVCKLGDMLLENIKSNMKDLEKLLKDTNDHWVYEDLIYRYYHCSFKVYYIQCNTIQIISALKALTPDFKKINEPLPESITEMNLYNPRVEKIIKEGTGKVWEHSHNNNWDSHTRPMVEAFFHAKFFLEMAVKYGKELDKAPDCLPSGWAALLYFYNLR